ncbi:hypothetical protein Adu01nite_83810 [Paractinoplanes durhamensis]|uniref:Uncharacterized protein n=1 Tax=Paractinoplanes durhamensis TaxID=113563 RepID=A0ABQ3ZB21_9ACTN|nr:hypothetical protein Adu01nite_83810 [Actinoplanes durhamensis]
MRVAGCRVGGQADGLQGLLHACRVGAQAQAPQRLGDDAAHPVAGCPLSAASGSSAPQRVSISARFPAGAVTALRRAAFQASCSSTVTAAILS